MRSSQVRLLSPLYIEKIPQLAGLCLFGGGLQAQSHRQVDCLDVLGQAADGDVVHAGFGNGAQGRFVDAAGGLQLGTAGGEFYCGAHVFQTELVEHDDIGPGFQRLLQFFQAFYLDFHWLAGGDAVGGADGLGDAAAGGDVVFLDLEGVECLCVGGRGVADS